MVLYSVNNMVNLLQWAIITSVKSIRHLKFKSSVVLSHLTRLTINVFVLDLFWSGGVCRNVYSKVIHELLCSLVIFTIGLQDGQDGDKQSTGDMTAFVSLSF